MKNFKDSDYYHSQKPPVGLKSKSIYWKEREVEILNAMQRYSAANKAIPMEWIEELRELQQL